MTRDGKTETQQGWVEGGLKSSINTALKKIGGSLFCFFDLVETE
jgi:hypothetical protein